MTTSSPIDTTFDTRSDAGNGDPDTTSERLREYHRLLWSKPLPDGTVFTLTTPNPRRYLHHSSRRGEFFLASDTVVPTFRSWTKMHEVIDVVDDAELDEFQHLNHTIGGALVFPGDRRAGTMTLNGARGFSPAIADRIDLTLDAIRRHYAGESNPLQKPLSVYGDFFELFEDFDGYVEFFLLQDLVAAGQVQLFLPHPLPADAEEYRRYRENAIRFLHARNARIDAWATEHLVE